MTLSCIDVDSISTTFKADSGLDEIIAFTTDGAKFKIFIETLGTSTTIDLNSVLTFATDRDPDCLSTGTSIVTDSSGSTAYSGSVFSTSAFDLIINTENSFSGVTYIKASTYVSTVFNVDKVVVLICGD